MPMTQPAATTAPPSAEPRTASATAEPWTAWTAWGLVPRDACEILLPLLRFLAVVRTVADHPALSLERKEAALAALAAPFAAEAGAQAGYVEGDARWGATAEALAAALARRGIEGAAPWQILQAAGQDLRKTRYRDWSELLTWSRFAAAPAAVLGLRLLGADAEAARRAEAFGIALQIVALVRNAPSHYVWLGRVYLPERWFAEARAEIAELGFARISEPLRAVIGRALDQAEALLGEGSLILRTLPRGAAGFRLRRAFHAALMETRREIAALRRRTAWPAARPAPPSPWARRLLVARATLAALTE